MGIQYPPSKSDLFHDYAAAMKPLTPIYSPVGEKVENGWGGASIYLRKKG